MGRIVGLGPRTYASTFVFCNWANKLYWTTFNLNNVYNQCYKGCIDCATTETPRYGSIKSDNGVISWSPDDIRMCDCASSGVALWANAMVELSLADNVLISFTLISVRSSDRVVYAAAWCQGGTDRC